MIFFTCLFVAPGTALATSRINSLLLKKLEFNPICMLLMEAPFKLVVGNNQRRARKTGQLFQVGHFPDAFTITGKAHHQVVALR
jgi:hypothetical protein